MWTNEKKTSSDKPIKKKEEGGSIDGPLEVQLLDDCAPKK